MWVTKYCQKIGGYNLCVVYVNGKEICELWFNKAVVKRGTYTECNNFFKENQHENIKSEFNNGNLASFQPFSKPGDPSGGPERSGSIATASPGPDRHKQKHERKPKQQRQYYIIDK